jgi:hypothetical protein
VTFSAFSFAAADDELLYVRPLLDGAIVAVPLETQFSGDDDEDANGRWARTHSMSFVYPNVSAGSHAIRMQFRSFGGATVFIHRHTTLVEHR